MTSSQLIIIAAFALSGMVFLQGAWRQSRAPKSEARDHMVRGSLYSGAVALIYAVLVFVLRNNPVLSMITAILMLFGAFFALREWRIGARLKQKGR